MTTDALELAMALHQAPIQRFALRDRPLPENVGLVLQLASATQPQLEDAATLFLETEDKVLEASRFYLHQILFEPGTDAYRILGLLPDADGKQVRQHYLWLQRWLHPDRRGEDWEAVFATKVNWAWQQLRNPKAREEYDRKRKADALDGADKPAVAAPMPMPAWSTQPVGKTSRHWLKGFSIGGLLVLCAGLFYLAATREDDVDADVPALQSWASGGSAQPGLPIAAEGNAEASLAATYPRSEIIDREVKRLAQAGELESTAGGAGPVGAETATPSPEPASIAEFAGPDAIVPPSAAATGDSANARAGNPAGRAGNRASVPTPARFAGSDGEASQPTSELNAADAEIRARRLHSAVDTAAHVEAPPAAMASERTSALEEVNSDTLRRFELARERLRSIVDYLGGPNIEAPEWDDIPGRLTAKRERDALRARNGHEAIDGLVLEPPTWRVSNSVVALEAAYRVDSSNRVPESGRFHLDMAWRGGGWKIARIEVLPSP